MATLTFQKILSNLSHNPNVQKLKDNFSQLSVELKKKETELKKLIEKETAPTISLALKKYREVLKTLNNSEVKLEKEVTSAISQIKKSATNVEKNIVAYRKQAKTQVAKIEKSLFAQGKTAGSKAKAASPSKKASAAKKTSKKTASAPKTSKKATSKKTTH